MTDAQIAPLRPFFPKIHGEPRVDDRQDLRGAQWFAFVRRTEGVWPAEESLSPRERWSDMGVFARMMEGLAAEGTDQKIIMIDATYLKAHRRLRRCGRKRGPVEQHEIVRT